MSEVQTVPTGVEQTFKAQQVRDHAARDRPETEADGFLKKHFSDQQVATLQMAASVGNRWGEQKTEAVCDGLETKTGLRLNQGAQGIVGVAIGIIATLMIGVVILGEIDGFADFGENNSWNSTAQSVTDSSQDTFDFLNLVPFLLVALFILGLMANRM